jgi:hypothetical protein
VNSAGNRHTVSFHGFDLRGFEFIQDIYTRLCPTLESANPLAKVYRKRRSNPVVAPRDSKMQLTNTTDRYLFIFQHPKPPSTALLPSTRPENAANTATI